MYRIVKLVGVLLLLAAGSTHSALPIELPSLAPMLDRVNPAVVNIATSITVVRNPLLNDPFFRRFFNVPEGGRYRRTNSTGSGVVVDAALGYIVTNNHVVERADEIEVTLSDGRILAAEIVGNDPQVDLAVVKVDPGELSQIDFGDSDALRVGDFVVAIGNPFGLNQTVTSGIVSALGRSGLGIEGYEDFIQTDASINPGNSGGALVDLAGNLVGINTAIFAPTGGNIGIGFAIPSNMVRAVMDQLIAHGEVKRGYIGLAVQSLTAGLAEAFDVDNRQGVLVTEVDPDSPAERAGIESGDVITRIQDREVRKEGDFHSQSAIIFVGDEVHFELLRNGRRRNVSLQVADNYQQKIRGSRIDRRLTGTELQNFRNEGDAALGSGVLVAKVADASVPQRYGLRAGDVIVAANRRDVRDLADLRDWVRLSNRQILLRVYRAGRFGEVAIR